MINHALRKRFVIFLLFKSFFSKFLKGLFDFYYQLLNHFKVILTLYVKQFLETDQSKYD